MTVFYKNINIIKDKIDCVNVLDKENQRDMTINATLDLRQDPILEGAKNIKPNIGIIEKTEMLMAETIQRLYKCQIY